jgi:Zn-dependent peptidase ImmA (M78 family)
MSGSCFEVPPLKRKNIRELAANIRQVTGVTKPYFPIVQLMELFHQLHPPFVYDIQPKSEMGDNHGLTYPDDDLMIIREDVYLGAERGEGRDRMTIAHEFGHFVLHRNLPFARQVGKTTVVPYRDSEWQANCFGGELLISAQHIGSCNSPAEAALMFGVTLQAAEYQWKVFRKEGLIR